MLHNCAQANDAYTHFSHVFGQYQTENGWEHGCKILGEADSSDPDQRRVEFSDGTVDDWDVEDFMLVKIPVAKSFQSPKPE